MSCNEEQCYIDRNLIAQIFGQFARLLGWNAGLGEDRDEPNWPVLFVDTPFGQVSWHMPKNEIFCNWKQYELSWDGHSTKEKRSRLEALLKWLERQHKMPLEKRQYSIALDASLWSN